MSLGRLTKRLIHTTGSLSSSSPIPIVSKPTPSKDHHHAPIPASSFPSHYVLTGIHCGIKKTTIPDLALIVSTSPLPTHAAACFTRNAFKAAPVLVSDEVLKKGGGRVRGVVVNSGCANAVTGKQGLEDAWRMVREADGVVRALAGGEAKKGEGEVDETVVLSTGVIGQNLPIEKIVNGIRSLAPSSASASASTSSSTMALGSTFAHWESAAKGFMTTDTFPKLRALTFKAGGREFRMAGMDKGAGMIHPDMGPASTFAAPKQPHATLLGCILTDAPVTPRSLQDALTYAVDRSFNSISVDGDMSTNDFVAVLANGAGVLGTGKNDDGWIIDADGTAEQKQAYVEFRDALRGFCVELAKLVVRDGEGATKFVEVFVKGAPTYRDAHAIASRISTSALVKTALYGEDANWGRILAATGSVGLTPSNADGSTPAIDPTRVNVTFIPSDGSKPLPVLVNGEPEKVDEARASEILGLEEFGILVELGMEPKGEGEGEAKYWTCDFSYEYVRINGDYRS
ncbi:hypothetical protein CVT24_012840 [Panaeolus cyanescens]|uniref:Arginine biosynthesis bifunctional protein ArgJ, mitochondrial n=1 Tax=Panaeolus cyanescens TaxID=181874 RepID=A0A409W6L3_9AGAR|nr:hypothetical protein CVT24_012840 [Panaeolus cyanescens]